MLIGPGQPARLGQGSQPGLACSRVVLGDPVEDLVRHVQPAPQEGLLLLIHGLPPGIWEGRRWAGARVWQDNRGRARSAPPLPCSQDVARLPGMQRCRRTPPVSSCESQCCTRGPPHPASYWLIASRCMGLSAPLALSESCTPGTLAPIRCSPPPQVLTSTACSVMVWFLSTLSSISSAWRLTMSTCARPGTCGSERKGF